MKGYHFLIFLFCVISSLCFSQKISISFEDKSNSVDSIQLEGLYEKSDALPIKKTLRLEWDTHGMDYIQLVVWGQNRKPYKERYWINGDQINVRFEQKDDEPFRIRLEGSPIYEELQTFRKLQMRYQFTDMNSVFDFFYKKAEVYRQYPVASVFLTPLVTSFGSDTARLEQLYELIKDQSEAVKSTYVMAPMHKQLEGLFKNISFDITKFNLLDSSNQSIQLEPGNYAETYILLDLWFVSCLPCVLDHRQIKADFEAQEFKKDIKLISISVDESSEDWGNYLQEKALPWEHYLEDQSLEDVYSKERGIIAYPSYFLLDQSGKLLGQSFSYKDVLNLYEELSKRTK